MTADINSLPTRKTSTGSSIETRPLHIEEWLDTLPYIDFEKTAHLLYEAIRATNKEAIKASTRLQLVELYNRPYRYYIDSQIKTGAQHTLQSISSMRAQLFVLKNIAVGLGQACKLAVDELSRKKTLWGQSKPPLPAMLMSLNYLSHAMIFSFLEYAPIPKNVWREVNFIYTFAQDLSQENNTIVLPGKDAKSGTSSIAHSYKKIVLASLADPNHLPFGAIWEIFEQLDAWAEFAQIKHFETPSSPSGCFVINLDKDAAPLPYSKFNKKLASNSHRIIDTTALAKVIQQQLSVLKNGQSLDSSVKISPYFARSIMTHMSKVWGLPAKRYFKRAVREGKMKMSCGIDATYFFINGKEDFLAPQASSTNADDDADYLDESDMTVQRSYGLDEWTLVDEGPGGFAISKQEKPRETIRVGELVGINNTKPETEEGGWDLGVIRWLMIRRNNIYKLGVQMIAKDVKAIAIRACVGNSQTKKYRRAFLINTTVSKSVLTSTGLFMEECELEINFGGKSFRVIAKTLAESSVGFEHFTITE